VFTTAKNRTFESILSDSRAVDYYKLILNILRVTWLVTSSISVH